MAGLADMNISIGAEISQLVTQANTAQLKVAKLGTSFQQLGKDVLQANGYFVRVPGSLQNTTRALAETAVQANKLDSSLARGLKTGANQATNSLMNLGRVAQDLPYGFLGVANNLNPLLESFQRLRAESGSNAAAMKALGSSLIGAGGLGFALSAGLALVQILSTGFMNFGKKVKEVSAENKAAADSFKEIVSSITKEATAIEIIVRQLQSENLSRKQRTAAIKELQSMAPAYFATLDAEKATIGQITSAYNAYAASISRAIQARVSEKQLEGVATRIAEIELKGIQRTSQTVDENGKLVTSLEVVYDAYGKASTAQEDYQRFSRGTINLTKEEAKELENLRKTKEFLINQIVKTKPIDFKIDKDKAERDVETIAEFLAKMRKELAALTNKEIKFKTDESEDKIKVLDGAIEELFKKFNQTGNSKVVIGLEGEIREIRFAQTLKNIKFTDPKLAAIELPPGDLSQEVAIKFVPGDYDEEFLRQDIIRQLDKMRIAFDGFGLRITPYTSLAALKPALEKAKADLISFQTSVSDVMTNVATSFAEGFTAFAQGQGAGNLLAGVFQGLLGTIGDFLIQMGKGAIKAALLATALKKIAAVPQLSFVAGIAAIAAGTLIKSFKIPGFAEGGEINKRKIISHASGGSISGPGTGKSDSILARLSNGEFVVKADIVKKHGVGFFNKINQGRSISNFTSGLSNITNNITNPAKLKMLPAFAVGGQVSGPGTGRSDSILARISNGEFVVKADIVKKFGVSFFNTLNRGGSSTLNKNLVKNSFANTGLSSVVKNSNITNPATFNLLPAFAEGGLVSSAVGIPSSASQSSNAAQITGGQDIDVHVHGQFELRNDRLSVAVGRGNTTISKRG